MIQPLPPQPQQIQPLPPQSQPQQAPAKLPVLQEIKCPNCGNSLPQYNPSSQTLVCNKCNSYVVIGGESPQIKGKSRPLPEPPAPIKLGQRFTVNNTRFFTMGRVVYEGWDTEEPTDRWRWTEWLLGSDDGRLIWLSHSSDEGFYLFTKLRIKEAFDPIKSFTIPLGGDKKAYVKERYPAVILAAEGELTWQASQGEKLTMIEGAGANKKYSIQHTLQELEVYEGTAITEQELAEALGDQKWVEEIKKREDTKKFLSMLGTASLVFSAVALVLAIIASTSGQRMLTQTVRLYADVLTAQIPVNFEIPGRPAVIKMWAQSAMPANTAYDIDVEIISPDGTETYIFNPEFWHETGYDEGTWTETSTYSTDMFVPHQRGQHTLEFTLTPVGNANDITILVEVQRDHVIPHWLFGYGIVVGIIGVLLMARNYKGGITIVIIIAVVVAIMLLLSAAGIEWGDLIEGFLDA